MTPCRGAHVLKKHLRLARPVPILKEFREFALKGNVVDLAVGVIIGAAFGTIVKSLVDDMIMPVVGVLTGGVNFADRWYDLKGQAPHNATLADARATTGSSVVAYGQFFNNVLTFLIVAWAVFLLVKGMNRLRRKKGEAPAPTTRPCPYCDSPVSIKAQRCPACTSMLDGSKPAAPAGPGIKE